jgi:hypothetical protein
MPARMGYNPTECVIVTAHYTIADICPGCHTPLVSGAISSAMESARQFDRIWGVMPVATGKTAVVVLIRQAFPPFVRSTRSK